MKRKKLAHARLALVLIATLTACSLPEGLATLELFVSVDGNDANDCQTEETACASLHRAIEVGNELPSPRIHISEGTYSESEPLTVNVSATLIGEGVVIINNLLGPNPFSEDPFLAMFAPAGGFVRLQNLTIHGQGNAGIRAVNGRLELENVILQNMLTYAITAADAVEGSVEAHPDVRIRNSEIINVDGVAISASGSDVTFIIEATAISHTSETAILNYGGTFTLDHVLIYDNIGQPGYPSAILNTRAHIVLAPDSGQPPGGIFHISHSAIYGNIAESGMETIRHGGELLEMSNSTVSSNTGTGILAGRFSDTVLTHVTIADNTGVGLYTPDVPYITVAMINSLIVNNGRDCDFRVTYETVFPAGRIDNQENIDSDNTCNDFNAAERAAWDFDPGVEPLSYSDGTATHALDPDSPAVDAVDCILPDDQRGVARPFGDRCDVGAYELSGFAVVLQTATASATLPTVPTLTDTAQANAQFTLTKNSFCRKGPASAYEDIADFQIGQILQIDGKSQSLPVWWWVLIPDTDEHCWISDSVGLTSGILDGVLVISAPPLPTATPSPTDKPTPTVCATDPQNPKVCK